MTLVDTKFTRYLLDTNTISNLIEQNPSVMSHYREVYPDCVLIPIIAYAESVRGWVNLANNNEKKADLCYQMLMRCLTVMAPHEIVPFTAACRTAFDTLPPNIGVRDKPIAACAIANNCIVVTSNRKDFAKLLPDDQIVDWTVDPNFGDA